LKPTLLRLRNFKTIGNEAQAIELAPVTRLFGPNSAGKSTVLQSLIYLRELLVHGNYDRDATTLGGDWLDLGSSRNLIYQRDLDEAITISVGFELEDGEELPSYLTEHEREELEQASSGYSGVFPAGRVAGCRQRDFTGHLDSLERCFGGPVCRSIGGLTQRTALRSSD
jgi:predicted ATPase